MEPIARPFFSVVIPLYNRAHLIAETVQSVLTQRFQGFEIIVVDDGSSDDPKLALEALGDDRIRFISQKNAGANTARNRGIDEASGRYIAFLDSDDRFLPHHLEAAKSILDVNPDTVVYGRILVDRGQGNYFAKPPRPLRSQEHMAEYLMCDRGFVQTSALVVPAELARAVRYLDGLPYGQDMDFAVRLFLHGARFVMLEEPSSVWRDVSDPARISSHSAPDVRERWLQGIRSQIPERAYYGYRGWFLAKSEARARNLRRALSLFWNAVIHGAYGPKLTIVVGLQVILSGGLYRNLADKVVSVRRKLRLVR